MTARHLADQVLTLHEHGAERFIGAGAPVLPALNGALADLSTDRPGVRIGSSEKLSPFLAADGPIGSLAAAVLSSASRPVRAIMFDKTVDTNWSLAWHQDRTICVRRKREVDGFGPWTVKAGLQHVAPPFALITRMVTLRVHLDDVPVTNALLLIAPGSHRYGLVSVGQVDDVVRRCGTYLCTASAGDVWLYATPILHASEAAATPTHRRVLQVDFAAEDLPDGLEWLGV